ncbi:MAG: hypothetical protein DRN81_03235 [Thermoproteota archaeon]|nr:MAG: hypothetical protein DRN81_03235 [Candidatus Korarchaeota archaeon]
MPFVFPELVLESVIKDGLANARDVPDAINDVFGNLTRAFSAAKYGTEEVEKIFKVIQGKEVSVVHSFNLVESNMPCYSIQLANDKEAEELATFGDQDSFLEIPMEGAELAATIFVDNIAPTGYNSKTGIMTLSDSVDLSGIHANHLFESAAGTEHTIIGGIINTLGAKQIIIEKNLPVAILDSGAKIKSSINSNVYQVKGNREHTSVLIGVHTKDALMTKYLYTLLKYFIMSRKSDMIARDFQLSSYQGSDFTRNNEYQGDVVYSRFLTITGFMQQDWRSDHVTLIDMVNVNVKVEKDVYGNKEAGTEDLTVTINEDDQ